MKVAVVGGGILGASAAYHLAGEGAEVVLVDRADEGRATDAGAGIVCPWGAAYAEPASYQLAAAAARYYPRLVAALAREGEGGFAYRQVGALFVSSEAAKLDALEERLAERLPQAPEAGPIERLTSKEARGRFPPLGEGIAAVSIGGGARVDGALIAQALTRAALGRGAQLRKGSAQLLLRGGRLAGIEVEGEALECDLVVAAVGAWADEFLAPAGVRLSVEPQRGQILHLRRDGEATAAWPIVEMMNSYYMLAFEDSRVVIGATRETRAGFDHRLTAGGIAEVLNAALAVAPALAEWTISETRIGFRPLAADEKPVLGPAPGLENLIIANGLGPSGLTLGPYAGALIAQLIAKGRAEMPLEPFHPVGTMVRSS
ncbi:MAG: NAD(P)/FAD-dependent oxidoreductase [Caulobacteraceae bacterium]